MANAIQPFPWYGGKALKLNLIIPNLPKTGRYVEPFGGSGTILLNRERDEFEVFNDIDSRVMTFFKALQENPDKLIERLQNTPYHEGLFEEAMEIIQDDDATKFDKAWAFFVRATCAYNSKPESGFAYATKEVRRNRSQTVSRFQHKVNEMGNVVDRLQKVQYMNRDALDVIERFDKGDDTVFYLDPPYPHGVRNGAGYKHEMTDEQHRELLETILDVDGYVCLSSFSNPLYEEMLDGWATRDGKEYKTPASNDQRTCTERIYMNYDPENESRDYQTRLN